MMWQWLENKTGQDSAAIYASQSSPFDGLPDELARGFLAVEHLRRVRPEWISSAT